MASSKYEAELSERVAVLETHVAELKATVDSMDDKISKLLIEVSKYKGWVGAFAFLGSCLMVFLEYVMPYLKTLKGP